MIVVIDNFDSFTFNLVAILKKNAVDVAVLDNKISVEEVVKLQPDAVLLSPGPSLPKDSNNLLAIIDAFWGVKPLLGVCLGMQALVEYSGGSLKKLQVPKHGKVTTFTNVTDSDLYKGLSEEKVEVVRYHSWCVDTLPDSFEITAMAEDGAVMSVESEKYQVVGIQYHPESILTKNGEQILNNWLRKTNIIPTF